MKMKPLVIGDIVARVPIIQGGMGVGVSLSKLAGADLIISGAGLPIGLPEIVKGFKTKIAPIVSSIKAASVILKMWDRKYNRTADLLVIEGPRAGGHLGFHKEDLDNISDMDFDNEIKGIIKIKKEYEERYNQNIPVVVAGGVYDQDDIKHALELGADGVQMGTRFVATEECDASPEFKQAYIDAREEDVQIVISPVGMPGRALINPLMRKVENGKLPIKKCFNCLERCNPRVAPYCITKALIDGVKGNIEDGLIFCGDNVHRIKEITTVNKLFKELVF